MLEFHGQTANIANMLLDQFRELYGEELSSGCLDDSQKAADERYSNYTVSIHDLDNHCIYVHACTCTCTCLRNLIECICMCMYAHTHVHTVSFLHVYFFTELHTCNIIVQE